MAAADALNYPYIRVRDVEWLKRTLLVFPHVVRMTPGIDRGAPADDPSILPFTWPRNEKDEPLLRPARLYLPHVQQSQLELRAELEARIAAAPKAFLARFGKKAAKSDARGSIKTATPWERRLGLGANFQIHPEKLGELVEVLQREGLAWKPSDHMADSPGYLEMHSVLGEAIMATLATACAEAEGLQVVTEFPSLHGKLIGTPREKILDACIDGPKVDGKVTGEHILEFIVHKQCKIDLLAKDGIYALHEERKALADFREKLEKLAAEEFKQPIFDVGTREVKIKDLLRDLFKDWDSEKNQLAGTGRQFFGDGVLAEPSKLIEKIGEALLKPETGLAGAQGAAIAAAPQAALTAGAGGSLTPVLVTAGFGFVVGVVVRSVESWAKARKAAKDSPLRYLTALESHGVTFTVSR
ncbi:hypothetical protein EN813_038380 [Mesorhizobium sp. M00.F.Ca.ET.170.01.1.1]|nr:hypothetical protein EN813_038380 [Mesorhizobium sp. M00.F.Ca.ET.170.01.1.1]